MGGRKAIPRENITPVVFLEGEPSKNVGRESIRRPSWTEWGVGVLTQQKKGGR